MARAAPLVAASPSAATPNARILMSICVLPELRRIFHASRESSFPVDGLKRLDAREVPRLRETSNARSCAKRRVSFAALRLGRTLLRTLPRVAAFASVSSTPCREADLRSSTRPSISKRPSARFSSFRRAWPRARRRRPFAEPSISQAFRSSIVARRSSQIFSTRKKFKQARTSMRDLLADRAACAQLSGNGPTDGAAARCSDWARSRRVSIWSGKASRCRSSMWRAYWPSRSFSIFCLMSRSCCVGCARHTVVSSRA